MASCEFAALERLTLARAEKALDWVAEVKTSVLAPASVMEPLLLLSDTTPLLMEESLPAC